MRIYAVWDTKTDAIWRDYEGDPMVEPDRDEAVGLVKDMNIIEDIDRYEIRVADVEWRRESDG